MSARIAASLAGANEQALEAELAVAKRVQPDMLEWRADLFSQLDMPRCLYILSLIRRRMPGTPLIFTLRDAGEGGHCALSTDERFALFTQAVSTRTLSFVDVELAQHALVRTFIPHAKAAGVGVILSVHNMNGTPSVEDMERTMSDSLAQGADAVKIVVTPHNDSDVTALMEAAYSFVRAHPQVPLCAISLGNRGQITRIRTDEMGCAFAYASLSAQTAAGQLPVATLRRLMAARANHTAPPV